GNLLGLYPKDSADTSDSKDKEAQEAERKELERRIAAINKRFVPGGTFANGAARADQMYFAARNSVLQHYEP
ncbi:MAG: hypothetical protein ACRD3W_04650, partial [Terriglobales bacterium]